jgi:beta-phosphoglucomutase-like phosphatase (HAD superfamily)
MLPHAIVFDFDGVLVNSEPLHLRALQRVLADCGVELSDEAYYDRFLGFNDEDAIGAIGAQYGQAFAPAKVVELVTRKASLLPALLGGPDLWFPGAAERVREFAGHVPVAIASGAKRHEIELVLEAANLRDHFAVIVASLETARSKPAPDPYARAIELLQQRGLVPEGPQAAGRCVAIEDSRWGIESAVSAGLKCVAVATSYDRAELAAADLVVDGLDQLTLADLRRVVG